MRGRRDTYYAVEEFMNDGASLGYGDVTFADDRMGAVGDGDPAVIEVETGEAVGDISTVSGTDYALRSGGTFVNALSGNVIANGTKLWTNLPGRSRRTTCRRSRCFCSRSWRAMKRRGPRCA